MTHAREEFFCGCCGGPCAETAEWCALCDDHVGKNGPAWERTYQAIHGKPCPYQVRAAELVKRTEERDAWAARCRTAERELAIAGLRGSPPPFEATIPKLLRKNRALLERAEAAERERDDTKRVASKNFLAAIRENAKAGALQARVETLEKALRCIAATEACDPEHAHPTALELAKAALAPASVALPSAAAQDTERR